MSGSLEAGFGVTILAAYIVLALANATAVRLLPGSRRIPETAFHFIDVAVAVLIGATSEATGAFLILSLYALLAAGLRWGFAEAVLTATMAVLLLGVGTAFATPVFTASFRSLDVTPQPLAGRAMYLVMAGLLVGYLGQREHRLRSEAAHIAALMQCADVRGGLKRTMGRALAGIARIFSARRIVVIASQNSSDTLVMWEAVVAPDGAIQQLQCSRLDPQHAPAYLAGPGDAAWHLVRRHSAQGERTDVVAIGADGRRSTKVSVTFSGALLAAIQPFDSVLAVPLEFASPEWNGRLLVIDPAIRTHRAAAIAFAMRIVNHLAPAVQNVASVALVRAAAASAERARIARELHDGVIQGVLGVEMHVAALMRRLDVDTPAVAGELGQLSTMLRQQVIELRELLQDMHPINVNGNQVVDLLADFVQRFQRETGITARLITQLDTVPLTPRACRELARILSEALVNVRRHSGASHVFVRLASEHGGCQLSIEDDGRGFPFAGCKSDAELEATRQGPFVIKQRVRALGGELTVISDPGRGARLEVDVPVASHAIHA